MKNKLSKKGVPFTMVANRVLSDKKLSLKAKGVYAYLYSKPDAWDFAAERIASESTDGKDSVLTSLNELEAAGYLERRRQATGRMEYCITYEPEREIPSEGKSLPGKIPPIYKKEEESKKDEIPNAMQSIAPVKVESFFKENPKDAAVPMTLADFVLMCRGSAYHHIRIIGEYADERAYDFATRGRWRMFGKRNMRAARNLASFSDKEITGGIIKVQQQISKSGDFDWGLETVFKKITS